MKRVKDHRYLYRRGNMFWFRRAVPLEARETFGNLTEVQVSLRTGELSEARHLLTVELQKFEERLSRATGAASPVEMIGMTRRRAPSKQEIDEQVRLWLGERMSRTVVSDFAGAGKRDEGERYLTQLTAHSGDVSRGIKFGAVDPALTTSWVADAIIEKNGWRIDEGSELQRHLMRTVGRGQIEASRWQAEDINGQPRTIVDATFMPEQYRLDAESRRERNANKSVSLLGLFEGYVAEARPAAATVKAWKRQLRAFTNFIGHDDASKVVLADVVGWKERLLNQPNAAGKTLSVKTVRDTYLSVLKTVFKWACGNGKIRTNPTDGVQVIGPRRIVVRERGLNDVEANTILSATLAPAPVRLSPERAVARRWVPWICAYTGARVNEITQLRAEDVTQIRGVWTIRITPEAGPVKDRKARIVALHPHIVEQGFPKIIEGRKGPIFFDPRRHRGGSQGNPQSKKVGEHLARWVREIGVSDKNVQPNHGWRHRFKTQARLANMDPEIRDVIQGHVPRTEGEGYGDTLPEVSLREILKLPRYKIGALDQLGWAWASQAPVDQNI